MITINTFRDLWRRLDTYPTSITYFITDEYTMDCIFDIGEIKRFYDKYEDYKVIDFCIHKPFQLALILEKEAKMEEKQK